MTKAEEKIVFDNMVKQLENEVEYMFANANRFLDICTYLKENADVLGIEDVNCLESWLRHTNLSAKEILEKAYDENG